MMLGSLPFRLRTKLSFNRSTTSTASETRNISEESLTRYCPGGYHPVRVGDTFKCGRYRILSKLGYGRHSTVWLVYDREFKAHVAIKVLTAGSLPGKHDHQNTFEVDILRHIAIQVTNRRGPGASHVIGLVDEFQHSGIHGKHVCLVFKAMGPDLSRYRRLFPKFRIPLPIMKDISRQLLLALSYLHQTCRVIHTDIKPQNIMIETRAINQLLEEASDFYIASTQISTAKEDVANPTNLAVRLVDFGSSCWINKHLTERIQPRVLRAPEVILGAEWDEKVDIWNLGLLIWELVEGQVLFDGQATPTAPYTADAHLAQMIAVLGDMPTQLLARSRNRDIYFDSEDNLLVPSPFPSGCSLEQFSRNPNLQGTERKQFLDFLRLMTRLDPNKRPSGSELLGAEWLREG
ncbi:kinase-like domain-containing protein [Cercophora scortea]|uniref:non-specific serine/threonine protein kinase n=1 Tax=Cercophora scortea TaxID=314031 RepID=A0AAE0IDN4_9PEZI|nr:kinase-like domain-containing protein [Cercophora scortea]